MRKFITLAMTTLIAAAAAVHAAPITCPFECLAVGASNQSACAPVAAQINFSYDLDTKVVKLINELNPGYGVSFRELRINGEAAWTGTLDLGWTLLMTWEPKPDLVSVLVAGIGGPDYRTWFVADCSNCDPTHTPEPATYAITGSALIALAQFRRRK